MIACHRVLDALIAVVTLYSHTQLSAAFVLMEVRDYLDKQGHRNNNSWAKKGATVRTCKNKKISKPPPSGIKPHVGVEYSRVRWPALEILLKC